MPAIGSHGTLLKIGNGAQTEVFTTIGMVGDISGPSFELGTEEATSHDSAWREYVPTLLSAGEVTFDIFFDPANVTHFSTAAGSLYYAQRNKVKNNFKLVLPDPGAMEIAFGAYVTGLELKADVEGVLTMSVTLQISGAVTITP